MARVTDAIETGQITEGYSSPMLSLRYGGQGGYAPNLAEWVSNQAYIQRNLIPLLMEAPGGFAYLPDPDWWTASLKALMELHMKSVTGLNATIEVDWGVENPVGGGGEMQQEYTNVTRQRSNPSYTWHEKYGRPINTFWTEYIANLIGDPDTKVPNISTLSGERPTDLLADMYTFTMLFIEPDPTHQTVAKAFLCANMAPKTAGEVTGRRELTSAMEGQEINIEFTALTSSNLGVRLFAQSILDAINLANANPNMAPAFIEGISADVAAADVGYIAQAENLSATAVVQR